jgi:hypothetical protein
MKSLILALSMMLITALIVLPLPDAKASPPPEDVTACGPGCVIGLLAIGIGVVVMAALYNFCRKHLPVDNPPPPPHHPAPDTNTNEPPVVIIPVGPIITLVSPSIDYSDISTNGWTDEKGNLFALYFEATLHCSTNQLTWQQIPLHVYLSFGTVGGMPNYSQPSNSVVVGFNPQGQAIFTNYSKEIALFNRAADQQYFRLSVP